MMLMDGAVALTMLDDGTILRINVAAKHAEAILPSASFTARRAVSKAREATQKAYEMRRDAAVLMRRSIPGMSIENIAKECDVSVSTIRKWSKR